MTFSKSIPTFIVATLFAAASLNCSGRQDHGASSNATFTIQSVSMPNVTYANSDAGYKLTNKKVFGFKACLSDPVNHSPIQNIHFAVSDSKREIISLTDDAGCMVWQETHLIGPATRPYLLHLRRTFRGVDTFKGVVPVDLAFEPWSDKPTLADMRKFVPENVDKEIDNIDFDSDIIPAGGLGALANSDGPQPFLTTMKMIFAGHDKSKSQIDDLLTLKLTDRFVLHLDPKIKHLDPTGQPTFDAVRGGRFHLTLLVLRQSGGAHPLVSNLVAHFDGMVHVASDSMIHEPISLIIDDPSGELSRNGVFLVMRPMDDDAKTMRPDVFSGLMPSSSKSFDVSTVVASMNSDSAAFIAAADVLLNKLTPPVHGLDIFNGETGVVQENVPLASFDDPSFLKTYCEKMYQPKQTMPNQSWTRFWWGRATVDAVPACKVRPNDYLKINKMKFTEHISKATWVSSTAGHSIKISRTLTYSKTNVNESVASGKGGVSLSGSVGWGGSTPYTSHIPAKGSVSINIGAEAYRLISYTEATEHTTDIAVADEQTLGVSSDTYNLELVDRDCVTVTGMAEGSHTFYSCGPPKNDWIQETYYVVRHNLTDSAVTDDEDDSASWRLVIRGAIRYNAFETLMTTDNMFLKFQNYAFPDGNEELIPARRTTQAYPGMFLLTN